MSSGDTIIPISSEGDFSNEDWRDLTDTLRLAEPTFQRIAAELNLHLLSSARWPELRLRRRTWWTVTELRLSLQPSHAKNQQRGSQWAINLVRYPRFAWLPCGASCVERIEVLSKDDLNLGVRLQDCMQGAVRRFEASG
jgi:hypothetical protein